MKQRDELNHDSASAMPQEQEAMAEIMVSVDRGDNRQKEMKIIDAYCAQYRGSVTDIRESSIFAMAVCSVPKSLIKEFKMKLQSHLETFRDKQSSAGELPQTGEKPVSWV